MPVFPNPGTLINRCAAAVNTDYDNCGAITACQLSVLTPDQVQAIFMTDAAGTGAGTGAADDRFRVFGNVFASDFEGRMVGIQPNGLYDFLLSQTKILNPKKMSVTEVGPGLWELTPYIKMKRRRALAEESWTAKLNTTVADYNVGTVVLLDLSIVLPDNFGATSTAKILADVNYFPLQERLFISGTGASGGVWRLALEVVESPGTGGAATPANNVTIKATITAADWGTGAAGPVAPGTSPATPALTAGTVLGLVFRGTPNVSDWERWCSEIPKVNANEMIPFWVETVRYSLCQDELVEAYINALVKGNEYYREWIHVDSVAHNRRVIEDFQRRHVYTMFFNQARPGQTLADYQKAPPTGLNRITVTPPGKWSGASSGAETTTLPAFNASAILDPTSGAGRCIGYKANAVGIYAQLAECGRVIDMLGGDIDLYKFLNTLAILQRARINAHVPANIIECVTDSRTAFKMSYALATYFGAQVNAAASTYHAAAGATPDWYRVVTNLTGKETTTPFGFQYKQFTLDMPMCELRIVWNAGLDDLYMTFKGITQNKAGRFLWLIDWTAVYPGVIENNSVTNKTGTLQELAKVDETYMCVMRTPSRTQKLISQSYTMIVEDETTSLLFENIGDNIFAKTTGSRAADLDSTYVKQ